MIVRTEIEADQPASIRADAACNQFQPRGTVRCVGEPLFRNQLARDVGCLLDLDPAVVEWSCLPLVLRQGTRSCVPDFLVVAGQGAFILDAVVDGSPENWIEDAAAKAGFGYEA